MHPVSEPDPQTGQPIGPRVDATPARRPEPVVLEGRFGRVEKLSMKYAAALWEAVTANDTIWTYMAYGPFADQKAFEAWIGERAALADPFSYAVIDGASGRAVGIVTLMEIRPAMRVIEVGNIVYGTPMQRTPLATEVQYLLARTVFETLGYRRYEWKCNALNAPSRRAALRFGFQYEGLFRSHLIVKGRNRDTTWYSMLDSEWPARKAAFERWLAPENFDAQGRQRVSLATLNSSAGN